MKREIEALEAQLATRDSILLESTVREPDGTAETSHLVNAVNNPSEVEMESSDADATVRESSGVEMETSNADVTVRESGDAVIGTNNVDKTERDPSGVDSETHDVESSVIGPSNSDDYKKTRSWGFKRKPDGVPTSEFCNSVLK